MHNTRSVQKVLQVDMLDWETFQNLYINKTLIFSHAVKRMWRHNLWHHEASYVCPPARLSPDWVIHCLDSGHHQEIFFSNLETDNSYSKNVPAVCGEV